MRILLVVFVIMTAPLSGCLGEPPEEATAKSLEVGPETLVSGVFQEVSLEARQAMSVFVPYLVRDPITGFVQNSTVVDIEKGSTLTLEMLAPPRNNFLILLVGDEGRSHWPVREANESWGSWLARGGESGEFYSGVQRVSGNSSLDTINASMESGGPVTVKLVSAQRESSVPVNEGGAHSSEKLRNYLWWSVGQLSSFVNWPSESYWR